MGSFRGSLAIRSVVLLVICTLAILNGFELNINVGDGVCADDSCVLDNFTGSSSDAAADNASRTLGFTFETEKSLSEFSHEEIADLRRAVFFHGVVRIPGQNLTAEEQLEFSQILGDPINSKNSQMMKRPNKWLHADVDGIFLAGNIDNTGKAELGMQRSEYWHHDADFMVQGKNMVFNILHTQVMPESGGDTGFIDCVVEGEELAETFAAAKTRVSLTDISDYDGDEKDHEVFHDVIQPHPYTGAKMAYLPQGILWHEGEKYSNSMDIFAPIIESRPRYVHTWEAGDVLIWDNLSTMHRSIGGFTGGRLLHRTQVFYMNHLQGPASTEAQ